MRISDYIYSVIWEYLRCDDSPAGPAILPYRHRTLYPEGFSQVSPTTAKHDSSADKR